MTVLDDSEDYSSLFVETNVIHHERGLIHKLDYHQPWSSPSDQKLKVAGWEYYRGTYYDPRRWSIVQIEEARTMALEIVVLGRQLRESKEKLRKFRDKHVKDLFPGHTL